MPFYAPPENDTERLNFLRTAAQAALLDRSQGIEYLTQDTLNELDAFLPQFDEAFLQVADSLQDQMREIEERNDALDELKMYLDDLWESIRRRVRRRGEPAGVFRFYYLDRDGAPPQPETVAAWLELGEQVIAGDADAVAAGFDAAACPPVAEIQPVLQKAKEEAADVPPAETAHDRALEAVDGLRQQVDALIADLVAELRFHLRKEDPASQRRVMRSYGVKFGYHPGEPRDMDDLLQEEAEAA